MYAARGETEKAGRLIFIVQQVDTGEYLEYGCGQIERRGEH